MSSKDDILQHLEDNFPSLEVRNYKEGRNDVIAVTDNSEVRAYMASEGWYAGKHQDGIAYFSQTPPKHSLDFLDLMFADITGVEDDSRKKDKTEKGADIRPFASRKAYWRKQVLFPSTDDNEKYHSMVTPYYAFMQMRHFLEDNIEGYRTKTITDCNAGVGGDCLRFAQTCAKVHCIDHNSWVLYYLRKNHELMMQVGLIKEDVLDIYDGNNVDFVFTGAKDLIDVPEGSVLFFDPNWTGKNGGGDIIIENDDSIFTNDYTYTDVINKAHKNYRYIVSKVPLTSKLSYTHKFTVKKGNIDFYSVIIYDRFVDNKKPAKATAVKGGSMRNITPPPKFRGSSSTVTRKSVKTPTSSEYKKKKTSEYVSSSSRDDSSPPERKQTKPRSKAPSKRVEPDDDDEAEAPPPPRSKAPSKRVEPDDDDEVEAPPPPRSKAPSKRRPT